MLRCNGCPRTAGLPLLPVRLSRMGDSRPPFPDELKGDRAGDGDVSTKRLEPEAEPGVPAGTMGGATTEAQVTQPELQPDCNLSAMMVTVTAPDMNFQPRHCRPKSLPSFPIQDISKKSAVLPGAPRLEPTSGAPGSPVALPGPGETAPSSPWPPADLLPRPLVPPDAAVVARPAVSAIVVLNIMMQ